MALVLRRKQSDDYTDYNWLHTPVLTKTRDAVATTVVSVGGARSSKSYSLGQLFCQKLAEEENKVLGISRKTFPSLRMSNLRLMLKLLGETGMLRRGQYNKTEHSFEYRSNILYFFSLDDPEKIKSTEFNYLWLEEANEFTYEDYIVAKLRLSGPTKVGEKNHIYLSLNPIDESNWVPQRLREQEDVEWIHSTYQDNAFLEEEYKRILEDLAEQDENYYKVYVLGEWGNLENLVYRNWDQIDELPSENQAWCYGLDFGYVNPSALLKVCMVDRDFYIDQLLYRPHLTNKDIIEKLTHLPRADIYADPTQLQMIEEIRQAGFNIYPAEKDVKMGLDLCKRSKIHITKRSADLLKEIRGYQYKQDKNGTVLEEPVKFNDHLMDCLRYGVHGLVERFGFATRAPEPEEETVWYY